MGEDCIAPSSGSDDSEAVARSMLVEARGDVSVLIEADVVACAAGIVMVESAGVGGGGGVSSAAAAACCSMRCVARRDSRSWSLSSSTTWMQTWICSHRDWRRHDQRWRSLQHQSGC